MDQWTNDPLDQWSNGPMDQLTNGPMEHLRKFAIVLIYSLLHKFFAPNKIGRVLTNIMSDVSAWQALQYSGPCQSYVSRV